MHDFAEKMDLSAGLSSLKLNILSHPFQLYRTCSGNIASILADEPLLGNIATSMQDPVLWQYSYRLSLYLNYCQTVASNIPIILDFACKLDCGNRLWLLQQYCCNIAAIYIARRLVFR